MTTRTTVEQDSCLSFSFVEAGFEGASGGKFRRVVLLCLSGSGFKLWGREGASGKFYMRPATWVSSLSGSVLQSWHWRRQALLRVPLEWGESEALSPFPRRIKGLCEHLPDGTSLGVCIGNYSEATLNLATGQLLKPLNKYTSYLMIQCGQQGLGLASQKDEPEWGSCKGREAHAMWVVASWKLSSGFSLTFFKADY